MKLTHLLCDSNNDNDNNEIEIDARIFFPGHRSQKSSIFKRNHGQDERTEEKNDSVYNVLIAFVY